MTVHLSESNKTNYADLELSLGTQSFRQAYPKIILSMPRLALLFRTIAEIVNEETAANGAPIYRNTEDWARIVSKRIRQASPRATEFRGTELNNALNHFAHEDTDALMKSEAIASTRRGKNTTAFRKKQMALGEPGEVRDTMERKAPLNGAIIRLTKDVTVNQGLSNLKIDTEELHQSGKISRRTGERMQGEYARLADNTITKDLLYEISSGALSDNSNAAKRKPPRVTGPSPADSEYDT